MRIHSGEFLDKAANVFVILACAAVLFAVGRPYTVAGHPPARQGLEKGKVIELPKCIHLVTVTNMVVAMSTRCLHCLDSVPFYKDLIRHERPSNVTLVALFPEEQAEVGAFLQTKQLSIREIGGIDLTRLNVPATPTILLLDRKGAIIDFWIGHLPVAAQQDVLHSLFWS